MLAAVCHQKCKNCGVQLMAKDKGILLWGNMGWWFCGPECIFQSTIEGGLLEQKYGVNDIASMFKDPECTPRTLRISHIWSTFTWHQHMNCFKNGEVSAMDAMFWRTNTDARSLFFVGLDSFEKHFSPDEKEARSAMAEARKFLASKLSLFAKSKLIRQTYNKHMQEMYVSNSQFEVFYPWNVKARLAKYEEDWENGGGILGGAVKKKGTSIASKFTVVTSLGSSSSDSSSKTCCAKEENNRKKRKAKDMKKQETNEQEGAILQHSKTIKLLTMENAAIRALYHMNQEVGPCCRWRISEAYDIQHVPGWHKHHGLVRHFKKVYEESNKITAR